MSMVLAFDFGMRYIGVAVGDNITRVAYALTTLRANQGVPNWYQFNLLLRTWKPNCLIVGLPLPLNGSPSPILAAAQHFAEVLRTKTRLPTHEIDESLTSWQARKQLGELTQRTPIKTKVDALAAQIILESWLEINVNQI